MADLQVTRRIERASHWANRTTTECHLDLGHCQPWLDAVTLLRIVAWPERGRNAAHDTQRTTLKNPVRWFAKD